MTLTLRAAITDGDTVFDVLGADDLQPGEWKTIDSEAMTIRTAKAATLAYGETARYRVSVYRGSAGTHAAAHDAGATVTAYSAGGSGLPSQWTDGGHGDVTAETDDASVPLTVLGPVVIQPNVAGTVGPLTVHGLSDPMEDGTANVSLYAAPGVDATHLIDGFAEDGSQTFEVRPAGGVSVFKPPAAGDTIYFQALDGNFATIFDVTDAAGTSLVAPSAVVSPLNIRGATGQTAPLIDIISDTGETTLLANGAVRFDAAAVADDDLYPGSVALWFDATNGAAKLRIKGKSANGTVVTGSVNLT